jgi:hypothetical protein
MRIVSKRELSVVIIQKMINTKALNATIVAIISHGVENMYFNSASTLLKMFVTNSIKYFNNPVPKAAKKVTRAPTNCGSE